MRRLFLCVAMIVALTSAAHGGLIVVAGDWTLQPNQAGQEITVSISGTGDVTNATVIAEIVGTGTLPSFTGGTIVDGTIFEFNNTGVPSYDFSDPQLAYLDVATLSGTVDGNGILAKITVSTAGVSSGVFPLILTDTEWDDTYVGTFPTVSVSYQDGSITIAEEEPPGPTGVVPEPAAAVLLVLGCSMLGSRRRR